MANKMETVTETLKVEELTNAAYFTCIKADMYCRKMTSRNDQIMKCDQLVYLPCLVPKLQEIFEKYPSPKTLERYMDYREMYEKK